MTTGNPFAAKSVSRKAAAPRAETPGASQESEKTQEVVAPTGSVSEVLEWAGDDPERAQIALDAENSGHKRKTLISKLKGVISSGSDS